MSYADSLLPEFNEEMANTRKVLDRLPDDRFDWKAHPKSNSIGWVASHLAEIPGWVEGTVLRQSWDLAPPGEEPYQTPALANRKAVLDVFDANVALAVRSIREAQDPAMQQPWSLLHNGHVLFTLPRAAVIRTFVLNHTIHHRAILCVYLRLNDIPVPGMYGPSGDE